MKARRFISRGRTARPSESGQTNILVLLALGIFFLGFLGFAVDYSNLWFHRQMAQTAADAACQAGAMDLLVNATSGTSLGGFGSPAAAFDCATNPTSPVCQYAVLNGYPSAALSPNTPGSLVSVSFPTSVDGVTTPPSTVATTPFIKVSVDDRSAVYFSALITGHRTVDVGAQATCGLVQALSPIPIVVLNPSCNHSFQLSGSPTLTIVGGPSRSVQVNSSNVNCAAATTNAAGGCNSTGPTIDLSHGGPNFDGSSFGVFGAPATAPPGFTGTVWDSGSAPIPDPFQLLAAPTQPTTAGISRTVAYPTDGCPDNGGCIEYFPGLYTAPITVKGQTAIFAPGVYYIAPTSSSYIATGAYCGSSGSGCSAGPKGACRYDFLVDSGGVVRVASNTAAHPDGIHKSDGSGGVIFYLSGPGDGTFGSVVITSNAGAAPGTIQQPSCLGVAKACIETVPSTALSCDGSAPDTQLKMPSALQGNILSGQCTTSGTYFGPGSTDSLNFTSSGQRGIIFFQDHANNDQNGQANMQGGGGLAISGTIYTHANDYTAFLDLQGGTGTGTFLVGEIITDQLIGAGSSAISMQLNSARIHTILKAELFK